MRRTFTLQMYDAYPTDPVIRAVMIAACQRVYLKQMDPHPSDEAWCSYCAEPIALNPDWCELVDIVDPEWDGTHSRYCVSRVYPAVREQHRHLCTQCVDYGLCTDPSCSEPPSKNLFCDVCARSHPDDP